MNCASCQTQNSDDAKFCMQCGAALVSRCPECGAQLATDARFCSSCGHQLSAAEPESADARLHQYIPRELLAKLESARTAGGLQGERRIVTMLFCDVQGSTAAAEKLDPEEWADSDGDGVGDNADPMPNVAKITAWWQLGSILLVLIASGAVANYRYSQYTLARRVSGKVDELRAKIAEFKEKGINTDELERVLAECEAEMGAVTESEE